MKTKTGITLSVIFFMLTILALTTCKKDKNEETTSTLTADKQSVAQLEIVSLTPSNITFNHTEYSGDIGGQNVKLILSDDRLVFLVPEIPAGTHALTTTIEGNSYSVDFSISEPAAIPDPEVYVNGIINEFITTIDTLAIHIDSLAKYGIVNDTVEKNILKTIKDSLIFFNQQFLLLSSEDQSHAVKVLSANMPDLDAVNDSLVPLANEMYGQGFNLKSGSCNQDERAGRMLCLMTWYNRISGTFKTGNELNDLFRLLTIPYLWWAKLPFQMLSYKWAIADDQYFLLGFELGSRPYHPMEIIFINPPASFINFEPKSINLFIKVRNAKEIPDEADKYWEKEFSSNLNDQITRWNSSPFNLFSANKRAFPVLIQPQLLPESSDLLDAQVINNANVFNIHISSANNDLYLKFGTNQASSQNFIYNIEYNDFVFSLKTGDLPATVLVGSGPKSIEIFSGNNQTGTLGQPLAAPIIALIKDIAGNPFPGTVVHFFANNGGSVSSSQVTTGTDGKASVAWTLGGADSSQTVTATAYKSDNTTHLQGSPLTFNATIAGSEIVPAVRTDSVTNITESSVTVWGTVTNQGSSYVTIKGACYGTAIPEWCDGEDIEPDSFSWTFSGLTPNTIYYVRVFAMNSAGMGYGNTLSFTTIDEDDTTTICGSGDYLDWWNSLYEDSKKAYNYTLGNGLVTTTPDNGEFITLCETTQLELNGLGLSQLNGLDFFQNLTSLQCAANSLTSLDVSGCINLTSLQCAVNSLTSLDVSGCINLTSLDCSHNSLTNLDVSGCTNLWELDCSVNAFPILDFSGNANLAILVCDDNYSLTSLDVSGCINLTSLFCSYNSLTSLDVSSCTNLTSLDCSNNSLTSLDVSGCINLTFLDCSNNSLTSLDVSGCINLGGVICENNSLTSLDVSSCTNLGGVNCENNSLTSLDVSGCTNLEGLYCSYNSLTSLDVSGLTNLESLSCSNNQLTSLDFSGCTNLSNLYCSFNRFTTLNVSGLINLTSLQCAKNLLTSLDISGCTNLIQLSFSFNGLTSIDVSGCINLGTLSCNNNGFNYDALVAIITLHVPTLNWTCDNASSSNGPDPDNPYIGSDCYLLHQLYDEIYGGK